MRWRSPRELAFRLNQEFRNLRFLMRPPVAKREFRPLPQVFPPDPDDQIIERAEKILAHQFPLLGLEISTGVEIHWRRDYVSGRETATGYFRRIPYLDAARVGDHKVIWELNRHQHLVLLAQAFRLSGRKEFLREMEQQIRSWIAQNPFARGINWASALEAAFRSLSWIWVLQYCENDLDPALREVLIQVLYQHGLYIKNNLSVYFAPNTHLLGEAVALHALGLVFEENAWQSTGARIVAQQMERQVRDDGSHFEQSTYYHVYALDMFQFHASLAPVRDAYRAKLAKMEEYLAALMGPSGSLPLIGDDDGGRFFPFGAREPSTSPPSESRWFPDAGIAVLRSGPVHCIVDAGPFGPFRGGHSHADTLSLVARSGADDLLIDPGTFSYSYDSPWRDFFRGTAAHNTVRVNGRDQAEPAGPFAWRNPPRVSVKEWHSDACADFLDATCGYDQVQHRRRFLFVKPGILFILDDVRHVAGGSVEAEQFWHPGRIGSAGRLVLPNDAAAAVSEGWRSRVYGVKEPTPVIVVRKRAQGSLQFAAALVFHQTDTAIELAASSSELMLSGGVTARASFSASGMPAYSGL
jgi:hypothetical protein